MPDETGVVVTAEAEQMVYGTLPYRVCTTADMLALNARAYADDLNRSFEPEWLKSQLDVDGIHVITPYMWHHHRNGEEHTPHLRCRVLLKAHHQEAPLDSYLDIYPEDLEKLQAVSKDDAGKTVVTDRL